jgi:hypothetical protein
MEEQRNWDPEVKQFFRKILWSFFFGLLWLIACVYAGIYRQLGFLSGKLFPGTVVFYLGALISLYFLIRYLRRVWRKE